MKILQVNKYLYRRAGAEAYVLDLAKLLAGHGHEIGLWGCRPPSCHSDPPKAEKNLISKSTRSFASAQDDVVVFNDLLLEERHFDKREGLWRDIKKVGHMIWSFEAARKFEKVLQRFKPDVVHIHNIYHHISPSILPVAHKHKVPVVMTAHDYHLINPNYNLYDHGEICERNGISAIAHKCIKDSYSASFADVVEWSVHKRLGVYKRKISKFLVPTEFVKKKLKENGMGERYIEVLPLPVILNGAQRSEESRANARNRTCVRNSSLPAVAQNDRVGDYILYAGRVTIEKGIYLLLEIAKLLPEIEFKIAGRGPEIENIKLKIQNEKLGNVELLGFLKKGELQDVLACARLVVVPSLWYDPSPFAVLEAQAAGKVVLASRIGGIQNLIQDGETGFLVPVAGVITSVAKQSHEIATSRPQSGLAMTVAGAWVEKIQKLYYDETRLKQVGEAARAYIKEDHGPEKHYAALLQVYKEVTRNY